MIQLQEHEQILAITRRHWFILARDIFALFILYLIPLIAAPLLLSLENPTLALYTEFLSAHILLFLVLAWTLIFWMKLFGIWTDYYLDTWLVTDRRVISIDQHSLFNREISSFRLERLQDVSIEIRGIIATFLNFGDMHLQTAGTQQQFIIRGIPKPRALKNTILTQSDTLLESLETPTVASKEQAAPPTS